MFYFDVHAHPQFAAYDSDRHEVVARARKAGVKMVAVGTQASTSEAGIRLAGDNPEDIWSSVGFHPSHISLAEHWHHDKSEQEKAEQEIFNPEQLRELARHPRVVAIGECGLDYFRIEKGDNGQAIKNAQKKIFLTQIEIAREIGKPLMIHCRGAFDDLINILKTKSYPAQSGLKAGIIHFFTGSVADANALLNLGYSFTFGGVITFARDYDEAIKMIPMERILSETDAPYVAPVPYRGKRNEPAYVIEVVKKLAELKGVSAEEMRDQIWQNAQRTFGI